eukprot:c6542_g1_i1.p1 GENE.c6542_g1_i1~~c6542_g1_i1.p1  ORF type:complete len:647 (+),score=179.26 c6542_g1_i1:200-1942(+)
MEGNDTGVEEKIFVTKAASALISVKSHNRQLSMAVERGKKVAVQAKTDTDQWHLKLQAIRYQQHNLNSKIAQCQDFKSTVESLELISELDFEATAPNDLKVGLDEDNRAHKLMINRLEYELRLRKRLVGEHQELLNRRKALADVVNKRAESLQGLRKHISTLKASLEPIQAVVGNQSAISLPVLLERSSRLPSALYCIFHQLAGFKFSRDVGDIEVEVLGDVENAPESPALNQDTANLSTLEGDVDDSGDDEPPQKRLRTPSPANLSQQPHPLSVQLVLKDPAGDLAVVFRFHAISQGSVGGVIGTGLVGVTTQEPALQGTLHDLYGPDPLGSTLPLAMQAWHPYAWAQVMSGTVFVPRQQAPVGVVLGMGATGEPGVHVLDLIRRIRLRVSASAALRTQLAQLTKLIIPVSQDTCPFPSPSSDVKLDAFEELHEPPQTLSPPPVVSVGSRFFKARFSHSAGVDLESIIHVSPEYPTRSPEHFLRFPQHPMRDANQHINHLRAMEREVNAHTNDFTPRSERASTLSYQVLYLEVMLGVYVQTELTESSPGNMVSVRASFGRDRQKPLVFNRTNNVFEERR